MAAGDIIRLDFRRDGQVAAVALDRPEVLDSFDTGLGLRRWRDRLRREARLFEDAC